MQEIGGTESVFEASEVLAQARKNMERSADLVDSGTGV